MSPLGVTPPKTLGGPVKLWVGGLYGRDLRSGNPAVFASAVLIAARRRDRREANRREGNRREGNRRDGGRGKWYLPGKRRQCGHCDRGQGSQYSHCRRREGTGVHLVPSGGLQYSRCRRREGTGVHLVPSGGLQYPHCGRRAAPQGRRMRKWHPFPRPDMAGRCKTAAKPETPAVLAGSTRREMERSPGPRPRISARRE